jgi:hypothetical protein
METRTIELLARELFLIARLTGILLGYAVPDQYFDPVLVAGLFNRTNEKLIELLTARNAEPRGASSSERIRPALEEHEELACAFPPHFRGECK